MTSDELRELAQECADLAVSDGFIGDPAWEDLMEAVRRLDNAANILDGAP